MNKQITFGHILTILAIVIIPLIIWGSNVEKRFEHVITNSNDIINIKVELNGSREAIQANHLEIMCQLHNIELQLKDKENRK